jgi:hypothetical protein
MRAEMALALWKRGAARAVCFARLLRVERAASESDYAPDDGHGRVAIG